MKKLLLMALMAVAMTANAEDKNEILVANDDEMMKLPMKAVSNSLKMTITTTGLCTLP